MSHNTKLALEGILLPIVSTFGLLGNSASIIVLRSQGLDMKVTFRQILIMMAMFDTVFVFCMTISFSLPLTWGKWKEEVHPYIFPWILPAIQISLNGSIWSTVAVALERFVSIIHPQQAGRVLRYSSLLYIFPVILLAGIFNISRFYELETCLKVNKTQVLNLTGECQKVIINGSSQFPCKVSICPTEMRKSLRYCRDYILIANFVMMVFIPLLVLSAVNCHIYRFITMSAKSITKTSSRQKRDQRIARILIVIVLVFTCCNVPRAVINMYEVFHLALDGGLQSVWPYWCELLMQVSHLLLVFNSSINILIYSLKDRKFRKVLLSKLGLWDSQINSVDWENVTRRSQSAEARKAVIVKLKKSLNSSKLSPFRESGQAENIVGCSHASEWQRSESDQEYETKM